MSINYPFGKFNGKELEYLSAYLDSQNKESKVPWVQRFEEKVAQYLGVKYAVSCNSGTSGLHMAIRNDNRNGMEIRDAKQTPNICNGK